MIYKTILILFSFLTIQYNVNSAQSKKEVNFLSQAGEGKDLIKKRLIVKKKNKPLLKKIMGSRYKKSIFSYWIVEDKTIWILNSIGKYKPITAGFVVSDCKINSAQVLVYREQIGYEIKFPSFLTQFASNQLNDKIKLDKTISNISGATLSVNSMDRMARLALLLNSSLNEENCNQKAT